MDIRDMHIEPMDLAAAEQIIGWKYIDQYAIYNLSDSHECRDELLEGSYYAVKDIAGELTGFYCFGESAQVPAGRPLGVYDECLLDIGLGIRPALCGQGLGLSFLHYGMAFAGEKIHTGGFRLTVASFNQRAIAVYEHAGFKKAAFFTNAAGIDFWVMRLACGFGK